MENMKKRVERFVTKRLEAFHSHGPMFGDPEALELGVLMLLEFELLTKFPGVLEGQPRIAIEAYRKEVVERFPKAGNSPWLSMLTSADAFPEDLFTIATAARKRLGVLP